MASFDDQMKKAFDDQQSKKVDQERWERSATSAMDSVYREIAPTFRRYGYDCRQWKYTVRIQQNYDSEVSPDFYIEVDYPSTDKFRVRGKWHEEEVVDRGKAVQEAAKFLGWHRSNFGR